MLDVRRLRVLCEVARRGSIVSAAESLSFTPSAVSQQLAKLEREAGVALLDRGPRSIRLTEAGWALVGHAEAILERLELEVLVEEEMRVVLPVDHPAARQRAVPLSDLAGETWIKGTPRSSCHPFTERACRAAGFEPRIRFEFDDYAAMQNLVASGAGVAFAPDLGLTRLNPGVSVRPIAFGAPRRRVLAAYRAQETTRSPALAAMLEALRGALAERDPSSALADVS